MNVKKIVKKLALMAVISLLGLNSSFSKESFENSASVVGEDKQKVFVIQAPTKDLDLFRELAKQAVRLKPYGKVEINISELAEKGFHEIPEGRNFWYEYASYNPTPYKFFPDAKIAPFIPAGFVKKNQELILAKAKILREYGLEAAFWSYEPNFLPEEFFEAYPHLMGARVDHPRRGNYPAFAPCITEKETQEMFKNMVAELLKNIPEIKTFFFKTNDAGSGICWSDWQYAGPNGPEHCKDLSMGVRVASLMNTFKEGAKISGNDVSIFLTGSMFSDAEKKDIYDHLPGNCYFQSQNSDEVQGISSMFGGTYPVKGLIFPLEIIRNINKIDKGTANTVFVSFRASYDRDCENIEATDKVIDLLVNQLENPSKKGLETELEQLRKLCNEWAGEGSTEQLFNAFMQIDEANQYKRTALSGPSGIYWGVTTRHITRPLVIIPTRLTREEEAYFMPHIFNPFEEEARMDYTDIHGAHRTIPEGAVDTYVTMLTRAIRTMEGVKGEVPEKKFLQNMIKSLKIYASIFRSIGNFAEAQEIRDRNAEKLSVAPHRPSKIPTWEGDPELQKFNTVMRNELDNTLELIGLLEDGGMNLISHAKDPKYEDTFLLGPNLIDQLKLKRKIMLKHWVDIEGYMATPFK